ncbi:MAG: alpha/beta hydrolase [Actinomycetota bacterium]
MCVLGVSFPELTALCSAVATVRSTVGNALAVLDAAALQVPGDEFCGALAAARRTRDQSLNLLEGMVQIIRQVSRVLSETEDSVAEAMAHSAGMAGAMPASSPQHVFSALGLIDSTVLADFLVASPTLAVYVVTHGAHDRSAPLLTRGTRETTLSSMREARQTWLTTGSRERRMYALLNPRELAARAWAPPTDRMAAARILVAADIARLTAQLRHIKNDRHRTQIIRAINTNQRLLSEHVTLRHPDGRVTRRPHQLLWFDGTGDGEVIEVLGDLNRAEHLLVYVPGTGADLDRQPGNIARMTSLAAADPTLAVVVWQGADHPDQPFDDGTVAPLRTEVLAAAYRDAAALAGPRLAEDVEGLRLAVPKAGSDLVVMGHSYGGSIMGAAEWSGMKPDRIVHLNSAGSYAPVMPQPSSDLGGGPTRYSLTTPDDWIQFVQGRTADDAAALGADLAPLPLVPSVWGGGVGVPHLLNGAERIGHGLDPDEIPGVIRLDSGVTADGHLTLGHSGAFAPGSTAWRNLLEVSRGGPVQVLQPELWRVEVERAGLNVDWFDVSFRPPRHVVKESPWWDVGYQPPVMWTR